MKKNQPHLQSGIFIFFIGLTLFINSGGAKAIDPGSGSYEITVLWKSGPVNGTIEVKNGLLEKIIVPSRNCKVKQDQFYCSSTGQVCLKIRLQNYSLAPGSGSTLIKVNTAENPFSFFLRDINSEFPVYIPEYQVIVTKTDDVTDYLAIEKDISNRDLKSKLDIILALEEESYSTVSQITRDQSCPTWLGISRDVRTFQVDYARKNEAREYDIITPKLVSEPIKLPELNNQDANYGFVTGRGQGPVLNVSRKLEEGFLPILHTSMVDEDISYESICFVSTENSPLKEGNIKGTNYLIADHYGWGNMFTEDQLKMLEEEKLKASYHDEETVLYFQVEAQNNSQVPRYAWFKTIRPGTGWWFVSKYLFERETGFSSFDNGKVFCISKLDGKPLPDEEIAILLQPGTKAVFEFFLPHSPVSRERAGQLYNRSFSEKHIECRNYWLEKLKKAADIHLPEKRIEEMLKAGLVHLDLVTYGNEPEGTLAPTDGVYSPIGTESSPMIQFYNSMGWNNIAKRSVSYFLDKQHEDGLIQNFGGYMVETGAALWTMGEYYRYTRDTLWVKSVRNKLLKSCDFLIKWREENKDPALTGKGFGMISGKVADPEDSYHQFMLNAYAYIGIKRVAEMLVNIDPVSSVRLQAEADAWKEDIRKSLFNAMANSPVVPAGDGTWCPTVPPWPEATGPLSLYVDPGNCFSHGTFTVRDVLLGPLYLVFCEVLDPWERTSSMMLKYHSELFYQNNAVFSQPYYSRHAWLQLKKELVKPFLKTYYTTFSALADRETYTFWEHIYHVSPHKTHEEGWFLMETRWMLYMESGDTLKLLPGIPGSWLKDGENIELNNVWSYFGPFTMKVNSNLKNGYMEAEIECDPLRKPAVIIIRLPHPDGLNPIHVTGGTYLERKESVMITPFSGSGKIRISYE